MTVEKAGEKFEIVEMVRPDGRTQLLLFALATADLVRIHVDPTRDDCISALERDGFVITQ